MKNFVKYVGIAALSSFLSCNKQNQDCGYINLQQPTNKELLAAMNTKPFVFVAEDKEEEIVKQEVDAIISEIKQKKQEIPIIQFLINCTQKYPKFMNTFNKFHLENNFFKQTEDEITIRPSQVSTSNFFAQYGYLVKIDVTKNGEESISYENIEKITQKGEISEKFLEKYSPEMLYLITTVQINF